MTDELGPLLAVERVGSRVTAHLAQFLSWQLSTTAPGSAERALMRPPARLALGGGKRLRAALCYWGWRAGGGPDGEPPIAAASAVEMLHTFSLIHDDVMDHSDLRRGRPAVHVEYRDNHDRGEWRGSRDDFGTSAAILAGDLCLVWADMILNETDLSAAARRRGATVYDAMRRDAIRGQYLDLVGQAHGAVDPAQARTIALAKTASSATVGPLLFGAELAGAASHVSAALRAYAEPLGLAFQLHDDLLGAFGNPATIGKPSGKDLRDGKATLLLALARRRGGAATAVRIDELSGAGDDRAVTELQDLIESTGARSHVEREISLLRNRATRSLGALPAACRDVLGQLAQAVATPDGVSLAPSP